MVLASAGLAALVLFGLGGLFWRDGFIARYPLTLQKLLVEKAHFLMDQQFQGLREAVQAGLNRPLAPNLMLSGSLKAFKVAALTTGPESFKSQAYLEGEVQVDMK